MFCGTQGRNAKSVKNETSSYLIWQVYIVWSIQIISFQNNQLMDYLSNFFLSFFVIFSTIVFNYDEEKPKLKWFLKFWKRIDNSKAIFFSFSWYPTVHMCPTHRFIHRSEFVLLNAKFTAMYRVPYYWKIYLKKTVFYHNKDALLLKELYSSYTWRIFAVFIA